MRDDKPKGGALFIELMKHDKEKRSDDDSEEGSSKLAGIASEIAEALGVDLDEEDAKALAASLKSFIKACRGYE